MSTQCRKHTWMTAVFALALCGLLATSAMGAFIWGNFATTPCGNNVWCRMSNDPAADEWTPAEQAYWAAVQKAQYPEIEILANPSKLYNCHGYAWIPSTSLWLNNPGVYIDSHTYVGMEPASHITYGHCLTHGPTHSANCDGSGPYKAVSKWGDKCLCRHDWDYGPYGNPVAVYAGAPCDSCGGHSDCSM